MNSLIPPFDWDRVILEPWTAYGETSIWVVLMGFFVGTSCGLVGVYLLLRRMALIGDAISHSVLPGLVVTFVIFKNVDTLAMFAGAVIAGLLTVVIIEFIHRQTRVKSDAAICIAFTVLFAAGVAMMSRLESHGSLHIDADCVLYGEIAFVAFEEPIPFINAIEVPYPVFRMFVVLLVIILIISIFYKELLITAFDQGLSKALGMRNSIWHYGLMGMLSIVIVAAFESVGAILAIAMLIVPPMFASQISDRLVTRMILVCLHAFASSLFGYHIAVWLECSTAGAMVVFGSILFLVSWFTTIVYTKYSICSDTTNSSGEI